MCIQTGNEVVIVPGIFQSNQIQFNQAKLPDRTLLPANVLENSESCAHDQAVFSEHTTNLPRSIELIIQQNLVNIQKEKAKSLGCILIALANPCFSNYC